MRSTVVAGLSVQRAIVTAAGSKLSALRLLERLALTRQIPTPHTQLHRHRRRHDQPNHRHHRRATLAMPTATSNQRKATNATQLRLSLRI